MIIKRQPFYKHPSFVEIQANNPQYDEILHVKPYQIIVYVSITRSTKGTHYQRYDEASAAFFPAILDTGLNDNLCINTQHLMRWTGLTLNDLPIKRADEKSASSVVERREAGVWLHHNSKRGSGVDTRGGQKFQWAFSPFKKPFQLNCHNILVFPAPSSGRPQDITPRLPTLGLRALAESERNMQIVLKQKEFHFSIY